MKIKRLFIILIIMLTIGFVGSNKVYASTGGKSAEDAINWARGLENQWVGSGQCVAFISAYYSYLGQQTPSYYYAKDLINHVNDQPTGWTVIKDSNVQPQKGDILVYSNYGAGHVALYEADNAIWHANWGTDSGNGTPVRWNGDGYKNLYGVTFIGVVRPDFDSEPPKFSNGQIDINSITETSYKVKVKVSDNVGIDYVNFGVKAPGNSSFGSWSRMKLSNGYYEATIKASDYSNKKGVYIVHCYAFDKAGNSTGYAFPIFVMGSKIEKNLGSFTARITPKGSTNLVIGVEGNSSGSNVSLKNKSYNDNSQIWKFLYLGNNLYKIVNSSNGLSLDVYGGNDNNGTNIQVYKGNTSNAQKFYIMSYNGSYRIVPASTLEVKAINIANNSIKSGSNIELNIVKNESNQYQTFTFDKVENGLKKINGTMSYLKDGVIDQSKNTLVKYENEMYYVKNGKVDNNANTLVKYDGIWYYIKDGKVDSNANTLVKYNGVWFYVKGGKVNWNFTGIVPFNGRKFYIQNGKLKWGYNGIVKYNGKKYKLSNSVVVK